MKGTVHTNRDGQHIIEIDNGFSYTSTEGEARTAFIARIKQEFEDDYLESLQIEEAVVIIAEDGEPEEKPNLGGRPPGSKYTLEEVEAMAAEAKKNKGKTISFIEYGTDKLQEGWIRFVWIDKREPMAMYRIQLKNGQTRNKVITSQEITIFD